MNKDFFFKTSKIDFVSFLTFEKKCLRKRKGKRGEEEEKRRFELQKLLVSHKGRKMDESFLEGMKGKKAGLLSLRFSNLSFPK